MFWFKDLDTQKDLWSSSCIPNFDQNYNELKIKTKIKLFCQNLNSKTKHSMKNETIKLQNTKKISRKKNQKYKEFSYNSI